MNNSKAEKATLHADRTFGKAINSLGHTFSGWRPLIDALYEQYSNDDALPPLVDGDGSLPIMLLKDCFVNLALVEHTSDHEKSAPVASASDMDLAEKNSHQALQETSQYIKIDTFMGTLTDRTSDAGWFCITGVAGTGKSTLLQHMAWHWGLKQDPWYNRFDFVFRAKLNLLGQKDFFDGAPLRSPSSDLAWLIYKTLTTASSEKRIVAFSLQDIQTCLEQPALRKKIILLLDGFDEIRTLYAATPKTRITELIDHALTFANGVLTSRPNAIEPMWLNTKGFKAHYENKGLTEDNVNEYVIRYFKNSPVLRDTLLAELSSNPELKKLAQIPVNIAALCMTWDGSCTAHPEEAEKKIWTMTMLYRRILLWLIRRYNHRFGDHLTSDRDTDLLKHYHVPLEKIAHLAYDAFVLKQQRQTLNHALLDEHFPENMVLLNSLRQEWGFLRAFYFPEQEGEIRQHYFSHLTYQEFFTALHMADVLSKPPIEDPVAEQKRREVIQQVAIIIRERQKFPDYETVWIFLAGLLSTPEYVRGANYFWEARQEAFEPLSGKIIGLHPHAKQLLTQHRFYREALMTYYGTKVAATNILPTHLSSFAPTLQCMMQWENMRSQLKELNPIWDEDNIFPIIQARNLEKQSQQQYTHTAQILQWSTLPPTSLSNILTNFFPSWSDAITVIIDKLKDSNEKGWSSVAEIFCQLGIYSPQLIAALRNALLTDGKLLRTEILETLHRLGDRAPETIVALREAFLKTRNEGLLWPSLDIAKALAHLGVHDSEVIAALHECFSEFSLTYSDVTKALNELGVCDPNIIAVFRKNLLKGEEEYDRGTAAEVLGELRAHDPDSIAALRKAALKDKDSGVRLMSAEALGRIGGHDSATIAVLRQILLKDKCEEVCVGAIRALQRLGVHDSDTIAALRKTSKEDNVSIRHEAKEALAHLTFYDGEFIPALRKALLKDKSSSIRIKAAEALAEFGAHDPETIAAFREALLKDKRALVRQYTAQAIDKLGVCDPEIIAALRDALTDNDSEVGYYAAIALAHLGVYSSVVVRILGENLHGARQDAVAEALADIGVYSPEIIIVLKKKLSSHHYFLYRSYAAKALSRLGVPSLEIITALREAFLKDQDKGVRWYAAEALACLGVHPPEIIRVLRRPHADKEAALALKKIAFRLNNQETLQVLLLDSLIPVKTPEFLENFYTLNVMLLRVPLTLYATLPQLLIDDNAQRFFVLSIWLHSASLHIDAEKQQMTLNGAIFPLAGTLEVCENFAQALQNLQQEFIQIIDSCSSLYPPLLNQLTRPIVVASPVVSVFSPAFVAQKRLPEKEKQSAILAQIQEDIGDLKQKTADVDNRMIKMESRVSILEAKWEFALASIWEKLNEHQAEIGDIHKQMKLINEILEILKKESDYFVQLETEENYVGLTAEEKAYAKRFRQVLIQMHMAAMNAGSGLFQLATTGQAGTAAMVLSIVAGCVPWGGGALQILACLLEKADERNTKARMACWASLGTPDHVNQLSITLSRRLSHCLTLPNKLHQHDYLRQLLVQVGSIIQSFAKEGFYGVVFNFCEQASDQIVAALTVGQAETRAEQDVQQLLTAIEQKHALTITREAELIHRLFLHAAPVMTLIDSLFIQLIEQFCKNQHIMPAKKRSDVAAYKRKIFYTLMAESWHNHANEVAQRLEESIKREIFVNHLCNGLLGRQYESQCFFYFKPGRTSITLNQHALNAQSVCGVLEDTLSSLSIV